jgi:hypothetical protein
LKINVVFRHKFDEWQTMQFFLKSASEMQKKAADYAALL